MVNSEVCIKKIESPIGEIFIKASPIGLEKVSFYAMDTFTSSSQNSREIADETGKQLLDYFEGKRKSFNLPLNLKGTEFQQRVWNELINIPFGKTSSYLQLSKTIGDPKAIRAVGTANGANPIAIIIPCHRVIGSDGSLTGYAGGIKKKRYLLDLEQENHQLDLFES